MARRFLAAVMVVGLAMASSVAADGDKKGEGKRDPEMLFKKLDANSDGKLSKDEFVKLAELRKGDGEGKGKGGEFLDKLFTKLDVDNDGSLSLDEFKKFGELRGEKGKRPDKNEK